MPDDDIEKEDKKILLDLQDLRAKLQADTTEPVFKKFDPEIEREAEERRLVKLRQDEYLKEQIQRLKDDNEARKNFSQWIFTLTVMWLFFILMIIGCVGKKFIYLSDTVLVTLITTSTINVLAFFTAVTIYLFNKDKST